MNTLRAALAASLALAVLQVPAFAQKKNLVKAAEKAVSSAARKTPRSVTIRIKASETAAVQRAARSASNGLDRLFIGAMRVKNARAAQLLDMSSFQLYNEDVGVIARLNALWSDLVVSLHRVYFGPNTQDYTAAAALREKILADEAKFYAALDMWKNLQKSLMETAAPSAVPLLKAPGAAPRFFFKDVSFDGMEQDLADLISGKQDVINLMASGQSDMEVLYRRLLAFAHGKAGFPLRQDAAYRFLALNEYPPQELALLKKNLNSLECELLLSWGWTRKEIRAVISQYQSDSWAKAYEGEPVSVLHIQHDLLSNWRGYWKQRRGKDLAATARAVDELKRAEAR